MTNDELEQMLKNLEMEQNGILTELEQVKEKINKYQGIIASPLANETMEESDSSFQAKNAVYVVCLMLNPRSPLEWSGKQWHIAGKGKTYPDVDQAYQCLLQLQNRWPDYPLQVKRKIL
jgi:hypothetical protein